MTFSLMTLSITARNETLNKMPLNITYSASSFVLLSVVNLGVIVLSVVNLRVIVLSVAAPTFLHLNGKP